MLVFFNCLLQIVHLGSLQHENITPFYGTSQDQRFCFITGCYTFSLNQVPCDSTAQHLIDINYLVHKT